MLTHFAAKRPSVLRQIIPPFCGKTQRILRQNAVHYAAKRDALCGKMQVDLPHNAMSLLSH